MVRHQTSTHIHMKTIKLLVAVLLFSFVGITQAQTADEIVANYFENTGGMDAWKAVKGIQFEGAIRVQGMELPMTMVQTTDGRMMTKAEFQGMTFYQGVYDGSVLWSTNQMTMKAEKMDAEATANMKLEMNDFPDALLGWKEKGYTLEKLENETIDGTETFKLKLTKEPAIVDGVEVPSVKFIYFDMDNFVPIVEEEEINAGPGKGMVSQTKFSDYQEVDGLYFPFSMMAGAKGQPGGQEIIIKSIKLNPEVSDDMFAYPEQK